MNRRLLGEAGVPALRADFRRHVMDDDRPLLVDHRVADLPRLAIRRAAWSVAFHGLVSSPPQASARIAAIPGPGFARRYLRMVSVIERQLPAGSDVKIAE